MSRRRTSKHAARELIRQRLEDEQGTLARGRPTPVCLAYPSPYRVGMSSLGFQTLYRQLNEKGPGAHRAFLPDDWEAHALPWPQPRQPILTYEAERPISEYPIIALSFAYEIEITGVIRLLEGAGIPVLARQRGRHDPIIVAGGPITGTNPSLLLPFVDLLIFGEGERTLPRAIETILEAPDRERAIATAAALPHTIAGEVAPGHVVAFPETAVAPRTLLPAYSAITTPHTELADMFLIEPERGCSRQCTFCVMRGPTTGGMRLLPSELVLSRIPEHAKRVGLVGAAVTDHPRLDELVASITATGRGIGISSLRADRLTPELVDNLARGGYRQLTVASDGISERMRTALIRKVDAGALLHAAHLVRGHAGLAGLKVYEMIGVPGEDERDVDELIAFANDLADITRITLTFSTFVAKRNTPLDGQPFFGVKAAEDRLHRIRRGLRGRVQIRPQSPRWAYVEYELAQRGPEVGHAALQAVHDGGRYRDWVRAFAELPESTRSPVFGDEARRARRKGKAAERPRLPVVSSQRSEPSGHPGGLPPARAR